MDLGKFSKKGKYSVNLTNVNFFYIFYETVNRRKILSALNVHFPILDDVGFIRDVYVDIIARNFYNNFEYPVSDLCKQLGKLECVKCKLVLQNAC